MSAAPVRFGSFEFSPESSELRRNGMLIKLPAQPAAILRLLIEARGEVVSREVVRQAVWGTDTHVDFDRGLTVAIGQIRAALGDSAESSRYIQTVPRRGYRFLPALETAAPLKKDEAVPVARMRASWERLYWGAAVLMVAVAAWAAATLRVAPEHVIAVLPFRALDPAVPSVLPAALTDELIGQLGQSGVPGLSVLAHGSVVNLSFDDARTRLATNYIVEGSVRPAEGNLRVSVRLIETRTARTLWSKTVEQDAASLAGFDEAAAAEIAQGIAGHIHRGAKLATVTEGSCGTGWEQLRTARSLLLAPTMRDLDRAIGVLENVAAAHPQCGPAQTALADALLHRGRIGKRDDAGLEHARALASAVLAKDARNPEANNALAGVLFWGDWRLKDAEAHYRLALEVNPSYAAAHHDFAWLLVVSGKTGDALHHLRRAVALDPLSPRINIDAGWLYLQAHRFREAARQAERALELDSSLAEARACWSRALYYLGDYDGSVAQLRQLMPNTVQAGNGDSRSILLDLFRSRLAVSKDAYARAQLHAWLGEREQAIDALEQAKTQRQLMFLFIGSDPAFRGLRGDPRFEALKASVIALSRP